MRDFVAKRVAGIPPSGIRRFFDLAASMKDVLSLGVGEPDFVAPPTVVRAAEESIRRGDTHYTSNLGLLELRQAICRHLETLYGVKYDPATEILISVGVSEALHLAINSIVDPGDEIVILEPCFVSYVPTVTLAGGKPVTVPCRADNAWLPRPSDLEAAITPRTKGILVCWPNNPTGAVPDPAAVAELARLAEERDLMILSDEIYDRLVYRQPHVCIAARRNLRERTITLGGFSKDYAMTGFRIGYVAGPAPLIHQMFKIHQYLIMSAPTTAQHAALEALHSAEPQVEEMRQEYDRRRRLIVSGLNRIGLTCDEPGGAFYAFPSIASTGLTDEEFCMRLIEEERVAVVPGSVFGPSGRGHVRMSYATSGAVIEEALARIERFLWNRRKT